jgi:hypothetical protein
VQTIAPSVSVRMNVQIPIASLHIQTSDSSSIELHAGKFCLRLYNSKSTPTSPKGLQQLIPSTCGEGQLDAPPKPYSPQGLDSQDHALTSAASNESIDQPSVLDDGISCMPSDQSSSAPSFQANNSRNAQVDNISDVVVSSLDEFNIAALLELPVPSPTANPRAANLQPATTESDFSDASWSGVTLSEQVASHASQTAAFDFEVIDSEAEQDQLVFPEFVTVKVVVLSKHARIGMDYFLSKARISVGEVRPLSRSIIIHMHGGRAYRREFHHSYEHR